MNYIIGISWFFLSMILSCVNDVVTKKILEFESLSVWQIVMFRYLFSSLIILSVFFIKKINLTSKNYGIQIIRGFLLCAAISVWSLGLTKTDILTATASSYSVPIMTAFLSAIFLKEKLRLFTLISLIISIIGSYIATGCASFNISGALTFLILAEILYAILDISYKKYNNLDTIESTIFYSSVIPFLISLFFCIEETIPKNFLTWLSLLYLGISNNLLIYSIIKAYNYVDLNSISQFRYAELIISSGCGFIFFNELPNLYTVIGCIIIIIASFINFYINKSRFTKKILN